ncbi:MAG TPA: MGMT family protein, partial [Microlunatus sp.]|nr:MGMT family protein [Microlunatus sp.]
MTLQDPLTTLRDVDPEVLARLRDGLADRAASAGLLDLGYRTIDSPLGSLLLVASERGLTRIAFASQDHDRVLAELAAQVSPRILRAPGRLERTARELDEYFTGTRRSFDLPLDLAATGEFRRTVQQLLPTIGYGRTISYTELATLAGRPSAVRAAAS